MVAGILKCVLFVNKLLVFKDDMNGFPHRAKFQVQYTVYLQDKRYCMSYHITSWSVILGTNESIRQGRGDSLCTETPKRDASEVNLAFATTE